MNLLEQLTIKNLKLNKKRTTVTIIGIILSVALITAVASMYTSAISSLIDYETSQKGNFHYCFYDVPNEDINTFKNNRKIESLNIISPLGYAKLEESKNKYKPYAYVMAFSKNALENLSVNLVDGRLPMNDTEIVIPTHLKSNGRVDFKIGDSITLDVGTRINDTQELNQQNPFIEDSNEQITNTTKKNYKIVGIVKRLASNIEGYSAPGYTFITYMSEKDMTGNVDIYARYTKEGVKASYKVTANILGLDEKIFEKISSGHSEYSEQMEKAKYKFEDNSYLISLETNPLNDSSASSLGIVALIVCIIIIFTSVFCIENSFDISITEKIKQYGMLRSIGATKKQIKKNVFFEAAVLGTIGVPIGILSGFLASYILLFISNNMIGNWVDGELNLSFKFSWIAVIFSVILGSITIYLSAIKSAKRASRIYPITAIRNSGDIKIKAKKLKSPKIISKIFGVGGDISYKNLKRNKKKYRTTVISIIVSSAIFIALYSFVDLSFLYAEEEYKSHDYNISLNVVVDSKGEVYQKLIETTKLDNIENYSILNQTGFSISNPKYTDEYKKALNFQNEKESGYFDGYVEILSIDAVSYKKYIEELGLYYNDMKNKAILFNMNHLSLYDEEKDKNIFKNVNQFDYSIGDVINGEDSKGNIWKDLEIGFVTDNKKPFSLTNATNPMIIVSDELFNSIVKDNERIEAYYQSSNPNKLQDEIEEILKDNEFYLTNIDENLKMMENLYTLLAIFLYGFIIVISLIGITNIFNTITTNMQLRKPEFAMLKSIGMTSKEFSKMIRLESIFMGVKSLVFGIPIGIVFSYLIYIFLAKDLGIKYPLPIKAIIIVILAVFLLITCIMKYSMNKIDKQNTIETIRNENI